MRKAWFGTQKLPPGGRNPFVFVPERKIQYKPNQVDVISRGKGGRSSVSGLVVTVFGSTGFLGRYVVNRLGKIGSQVVIPFRGEETSFRHLKVMGDLGQIIPIKVDIRDHDSILKAVSHSSVVINLMGKGWPTRNFTLDEANYHSAYVISKAAREAGVDRLIHVSAFGASSESPSAWLRSKAYGEEAVKEFFPTATILRPTPMFGHESRFTTRYGYLARFFPVYFALEPDDALIQPLFASDFATALMNALEDPSTAGKVYELGGPKVYTRKDIRELVMETCHNSVNYKRVLHLQPTGITSPFLKTYLHLASKFFRTPQYTFDEWQYLQNDLVVPDDGQVLTIKDLGVRPDPLEKHAINLFRAFVHTRLKKIDPSKKLAKA